MRSFIKVGRFLENTIAPAAALFLAVYLVRWGLNDFAIVGK